MTAMATLVMPLAASFAITAVCGFVVVPWLRRLQFGRFEAETINGKNKENNLIKSVPTMGGIMLIVGVTTALLLTFVTDKLTGGDMIAAGSMVASEMYTKFWTGLIMALSFAFIGFADDYLKTVKHMNLGLTFAQRSAAQLLAAVAYLASLFMGMKGGPYMFLPFVGSINIGAFFWLFGAVLVFSTVNAAQITDEIDGVCTSVTFVSAISLGIVAYIRGYTGISAMAAALSGGCAGFFVWNKSPAKVKLGGTGNLFLGAMTVAIAYATSCPIIIIPACIAYAVEGLSVAISVFYYRLTGKHLAVKAPLQRHLSGLGLSNGKITLIFLIISLIGGAAAVAVVYFGG